MAKKRYLFVDAFNVMHAFGNLSRAFYKGIDSARDQLADKVGSIHDAEGIHTILILSGSSDLLKIDYPLGKKTFEYVYTPTNLSTDDVVNQLLACISGSTRTTVASNDAKVRESARINGAIAISAEDLYNWVCACERRLIKDAECWRMLNENKWNHSKQRQPELLRR